MDRISVEYKTIDEKEFTLIKIGEASDSYPSHLLSGEKEGAYIFKDGELTQWYWSKVSDIDSFRYILFPKVEILSFDHLATTLKNDALSYIRTLAEVFIKLPQDYLNPFNGFIECWRVYFIVGGGVLILPQQLSQVILLEASATIRQFYYYDFLVPNTHPPYGLISQLTQFLYFSATGFLPFEKEVVKLNKFKVIPLELGFSGLDKSCTSFIDKHLQLKATEQNLVASAAYSAEENLNYFLKESENLKWEFHTKELEAYENYLDVLNKKIEKKKFLKAKGPLFGLIALILLLALSVGISAISSSKSRAAIPSLEPLALITHFYEANNLLDLSQMSLYLNKRVKNPFEKEVSTLFVAQQMRKAYQSVELKPLDLEKWALEGFYPISIENPLWGIFNLQIKQIDSEVFVASYDKIEPIGDKEVDDKEFLIANLYKQTVQFTIKEVKNKNLIDKIEILDTTLIETIEVEIY